MAVAKRWGHGKWRRGGWGEEGLGSEDQTEARAHILDPSSIVPLSIRITYGLVANADPQASPQAPSGMLRDMTWSPPLTKQEVLM